MEGFLKDDIKGIRSQDLPKYYRINGAIYICKTVRLMNEKTFFIDNNIFAYKMNRISSVDIDVKEDFLLAESFMNNHE
jgi:CMP-N-acetylneuraminic acid synthetase